jgi:Holliday junction resolvase RusA-like endonuclease
VAAHGMRARRAARWPTFEGPVEVELRVFFVDERPDTDGPVKAILDALQPPNPGQHRFGAGIIRDDRQVRRLLVERGVDAKRPRVEVAIAPVGELIALSTVLRGQSEGSAS